MRRQLTGLLATLTIAAGAAVSSAQTPIDTGWTYQGRLTTGGTPATGSYDLRFTLFSDAVGASQAGAVLNLPGVAMDAGLFTVKLDFGAQFSGSKRWLRVDVSPPGAGNYTALPLQEISSAPQSLYSPGGAGLSLPYTGSAGVAGPNAVFRLVNSDTSTGSAVWGETAGTNGIGVQGTATATTGYAYGGLFRSASTDARGVHGEATATTGLAIGGRFGSASTAGRGVFSTASATTGLNQGVWGESFSTSGTGVYGIATSTSGFNFGGQFESNSPDGRAVRAINNATSGLAVAARVATGSPAGISIWSTASASSGVNYALYCDSLSPSGYGGYFRNSAGGTALWADGLAKVKTLQILGGADLAEPFNVHATESETIKPGMVVVIDEANPGDLRLTQKAYDTRVAGVISGANGLQPGMVMRSEGAEKADGQHAVAMTGRVWCYVDASFGAIEPGDRLTTSSTSGYAMRASDQGLAGGAVIGKAMTGLRDGKGLVMVLVNLQ
jgi:hypothetical protein